ncbi:hypothetical protein, partial [Komagataeibacter diospyri]|uniref:hypothetical protein n=1 Tax=Komagataeibacter diospyri TaxID=1932662 RepID=UPI001D03689A
QIKHLSHAVVTDSHATPFPRSGFVLPRSRQSGLQRIKQTGGIRLHCGRSAVRLRFPKADTPYLK